MAPAELLNATCVANITANYTLFNTSMGNLTTCATPANPVNQAWFHLTFTRVALMSMLFAFKLSSILMVIMTSRMIYNLWSTPSYELHQELEKWYSGGLRKSEKKKYEKNHEGRYKSVTHTDDTFTGTRTITIVEDLTRVPPEKKKKKEKKQKRGEENIPLRPLRQDDGENAPPWTPAGQAWARSQTMDPPFTGARSSWYPAAGLATAPATARSSNLMATEGTEEDMTVPPPAYNGEGHIWQEYV
jgi:hypothetical protein